MTDIQLLCLLPETLFVNLKECSELRHLFVHMDKERFVAMMSKIVGCMMSDTSSDFEHRHMHITRDHVNAWMSCFAKTLEQLGIEGEYAYRLRSKMNRILNDMMKVRTSEDICHTIRKAISLSNNPVEFIKDIKHCLEEINPQEQSS
jgi:truncated hemoglobin YjbI